MINRSTCGALLASTVLLASCGHLFHANFEGDLPGKAPSPRPEGFPDGDLITIGPEESFFVTSDMGIVGEKSFAFVEPKVSGKLPPRTVMRSALIEDMQKPVHMSWRGIFGTSGSIKMKLGFAGQTYADLHFDHGTIFVDGKRSGVYKPGDIHSVVVSLYPASQSYEVTIQGDAHTNAKSFSGNAISKDEPTRPEAFAEFNVTSSNAETLVYIIDDVIMSHRAPRLISG